ncbi:MAG: hypothetical protein EOO28_13950 [Comamonadaceae bacterium]|nr:MAG: hypothetical protein EOO28_13950 [Comamonadaceae bacterium]
MTSEDQNHEADQRNSQLPCLAMYVDHWPSGEFYWVVMESGDHVHWRRLDIAGKQWHTWIEAFDAGNTKLLKLMANPLRRAMSSPP